MKKLILGTRGSLLALRQSQMIADQITSLTGVSVNLKIISTKGDRIQDRPLAAIGGKGLFTLELEEALRDGSIHLAVHSLKDLPTEDPEGLMLGAIPMREDPRDALIGKLGLRLGTGSLRRKSQLLKLHPKIQVSDLRGNVDTRLRKLDEGLYDAIVLAMAGLNRLGISRDDLKPLSIYDCIPACGQGALGVQCSKSNAWVAEILNTIHHPDTAACVREERRFLQRLGGGCNVSAACHVWLSEGQLKGIAMHSDTEYRMSELEGENIGIRLYEAMGL